MMGRSGHDPCWEFSQRRLLQSSVLLQDIHPPSYLPTQPPVHPSIPYSLLAWALAAAGVTETTQTCPCPPGAHLAQADGTVASGAMCTCD